MKEERAQRWQARSEDVGTAPYLGSCGELQSARELHLHNHTIARGPIITDVLTEIGLVLRIYEKSVSLPLRLSFVCAAILLIIVKPRTERHVKKKHIHPARPGMSDVLHVH